MPDAEPERDPGGSSGIDSPPASRRVSPMSETLKVYVKPGCPWCVDAEAWLKREGYGYERIDVYANPSAYDEMKRLSGQSCAPTMTYGDLLLADFGVPELEAFLEKHAIHPE